MAVSTRQRILEVLRARLQAIATADGFQTDVGDRVFLGEVVSLADADHALALVAQEDEVGRIGENVQLVLPVQVQAWALASLDEPWGRVEAMIADIKRAIELPDRTLGGLVPARITRRSTRAIERQEGSLVVGATVTYAAPYAEGWGTP